MRRFLLFVTCGATAFGAIACGSKSGAGDASTIVQMAPFPDATVDADTTDDAGATDATVDATVDASNADAGTQVDAHTNTDGGPGPTNGILLLGTIVTPDATYDGQVLIIGSTIACAEAGTACAADPRAAGAMTIDTQGIIAPGFIDTHNHILFDIFDNDDWLPAQLYQNHNQWTSEPRYQAMLDVKQCLEDASQGKPVWCPATYDGAGSLKCEMDKWGELKGMIAGTTSIVGLPGTSSNCFSSLSRSIDVTQNGLGIDDIQTSAIFPPSRSSADGVCANFTSMKTTAYLVHCGEGLDATSLAEWTKLGTAPTTSGCLYAPETVITHGTAFTSTEFAQMATYGMKLTWSPASNVALYGSTTNIPAALDAHVTIALAPDWSMGGSQNILDEMRFADAWDDAHFGNRLSAKDIVLMTTKNAAAALGLSAKLGAVQAGYLADLVVVPKSATDPYASILAARPKTVMLTIVGGNVLYGDASLKGAAAASPGCEDIAICGVNKFLCVAQTSASDKLNQTYVEIKSALEAALVDADNQTLADGYHFAPLAPIVHCD